MIEIGFKIGLGLLLANMVITAPLWLLAGWCEMASRKQAENHKDGPQPNDETLLEELKGIWPRLKWALPVPLLLLLLGVYKAFVH